MNDATECPYCGGSINVGATRCRHCREDLRATLRPGQVIAEGSTLGDYVLGPLLGRGAMGLVFRAKKARLPREFAIKVLAPHLAADPDLVARFEEEARVQASLRHPHIVDVVDSIAAGGAFAFVMELIEGSTLEQLLAERRGPLPLPRILAIMDAALDAVGFAHEQDIVHRDLKPGNILLARVAGREVVKVADFGLARVLGNQRRTATGAALGTYLYMAPEQCRGDLDVDHRADLYSLGATLFELVTGLTPFTGKTDYEIVGGHLQRPPPRPSELVPTLPRELDDVILRALEKSPAARFPSAAAFRAALADVPHALRPAPPPANPLRATGTLPASVKEGAILGRYRLDAKLGEGAMGAVFRATDLELPRAVAVKVLSQEVVAMPGIVERLAREARLQAAVPHPHIVAVHDFVQRGGVAAIAMELVDGRTLEKLLEQESPLSPARCLEIVGPMLEALAHVHAQGIVHRDLKPGNVMLAGGRRETVKVADFGLALRPSEPRMSKAGQVMGTPLYMSPEQCNAADLDGRSDLYAVGVMLFEMLTGRLPFTGGSFAALAVAHTTEARPRPSAFIGGLPSPLDDVVVRAMATDPAARFASAHDMLDALERAIRPAAPPRPPVADPPDASRRPPPPQPPRFTSPDVGPSPSEPPAVVRQTTPDQRRRRRTLVIGFGLGGAALFAALAVGLGFFGGDGERGAGTASCPSGMVEVQGGEFRMGSTGEAFANADETPEGGGERIVTLASFCIDQSEVTVQDYAACVAAGNCAAALSDVAWDGKPDAEGNFWGSLCNGNRGDRQDHPVNCVSWADADNYCRKVGKQLPTEAQWEYAARVRTYGAGSRDAGAATYVKYPWGNSPEPSPSLLNACGPECYDLLAKAKVGGHMMYASSDGYPTTAPVGSFPAGDAVLVPGRDETRVHDLAGNVAEWTADWSSPYQPGRFDDRTSLYPRREDNKIHRGGGWSVVAPAFVRGAFRIRSAPTDRSSSLGFRCARGVP